MPRSHRGFDFRGGGDSIFVEGLDFRGGVKASKCRRLYRAWIGFLVGRYCELPRAIIGLPDRIGIPGSHLLSPHPPVVV